MSSFFFHMEGHAEAPERVRMRLDDPADARAHAVVAIGDLLRHAGAEFWNEPEWQVEVTDETGRTVCTLIVQGQLAEAAQEDRTFNAVRLQPAMAIVA
jgi:hypothetical protein